MLKRKYGDRAGWMRVLKREYTQTYLETDSFTGHITLLKMIHVREPLLVTYHTNKLRIVDDGFMWLQHFPAGQRHSVTTVFNADGEIVQWYIDICLHIGVSADGTPWMDDLFLDIVVLPSGEIFRLDDEELDEAMQSGIIDERLYHLAREECDKLYASITLGQFHTLALSKEHKDLLLSKVR